MVLGCPLGDDSFVRAKLEALVQQNSTLLDRIKTLATRSAQAASLLVRFCVNTKITYWLRIIDPRSPHIQEACRNHDVAIQAAAESICGIPALTSSQVAQLRLPNSLGGLGLASASQTRLAAFYGSAALVLKDVWRRLQGQGCMGGMDREGFLRVGVVAAYAACRDSLAQELQPPQSSSSQSSSPNSNLDTLLPPLRTLVGKEDRGRQHKVARAQQHRARERLLDVLPEADRARVRSCGGVGAGGWTRQVPFDDATTIPNLEWYVIVRLMLGIPLSAILDTRGRCVCGQQLDPLGVHLLACNSGKQMFTRHNALVREFAQIMRGGGFAVDVEVPILQLGLPVPANKPNQRMDLVATDERNQRIMADVSVTSPTAATFVQGAARGDGHTARQREQAKASKYRSSIRTLRFVPLVAEAYGRWGSMCMHFVQDCALRRIRSSSLTGANVDADSQVVKNQCNMWWQRLSCVLHKHNAKLLIERTNAAVTARQGASRTDNINDLFTSVIS